MATKTDLDRWVKTALVDLGGSATIPHVAQHIWENHEADLRASGDLFYTWQYDMRWAAQKLVDLNLLDKTSRRGVWRLVNN